MRTPESEQAYFERPSLEQIIEFNDLCFVISKAGGNKDGIRSRRVSPGRREYVVSSRTEDMPGADWNFKPVSGLTVVTTIDPSYIRLSSAGLKMETFAFFQPQTIKRLVKEVPLDYPIRPFIDGFDSVHDDVSTDVLKKHIKKLRSLARMLGVGDFKPEKDVVDRKPSIQRKKGRGKWIGNKKIIGRWWLFPDP